jgi:hypothetical protein
MFSVAKGPKFRPQNTKRAKKRAEKGPNFFCTVVWFCSKTVIFLTENCNVPLIYSYFLYYFALRIFEKANNIIIILQFKKKCVFWMFRLGQKKQPKQTEKRKLDWLLRVQYYLQ